jgi:hypothetical protein
MSVIALNEDLLIYFETVRGSQFFESLENFEILKTLMKGCKGVSTII